PPGRAHLAECPRQCPQRQYLLGRSGPVAGDDAAALGPLALPGWPDDRAGTGEPGVATRSSTLARLALGGRAGQRDRQPGAVHQPHLGGARHGRRPAPDLAAACAADQGQSLKQAKIWPRMQPLINRLGPLDHEETTPIRQDDFLRDGDGGVYWLLA